VRQIGEGELGLDNLGYLGKRRIGIAAVASDITGRGCEFTFPYLAHASMEPMNAVVQFDGKTVNVVTGSQLQTVDQFVVSGIFGVTPDKVKIETRYAGGSFGRRAVPNSDYIAEAALVAKAWGKPDPVKLVWSREDDMQAGYYRPMYLHKVKAGLDANGDIVNPQGSIPDAPPTGNFPDSFVEIKAADLSAQSGYTDTRKYPSPPYVFDSSDVSVTPSTTHRSIFWARERSDADLGSAGVLLLGNRLIGGGKDGRLYVLDTNGLAKMSDGLFKLALLLKLHNGGRRELLG
jgi:hypothetical protein